MTKMLRSFNCSWKTHPVKAIRIVSFQRTTQENTTAILSEKEVNNNSRNIAIDSSKTVKRSWSLDRIDIKTSETSLSETKQILADQKITQEQTSVCPVEVQLLDENEYPFLLSKEQRENSKKLNYEKSDKASNSGKDIENKKRKKPNWEQIDAEEIGLYQSLVSPCRQEGEDMVWCMSQPCSRFCCYSCCDEPVFYLEDSSYEAPHLDSKYVVKFLDLELSNSKYFGRQKRGRKLQKAHVQIKDKYCSKIKHSSKKRLFIKHRVLKTMLMEPCGFANIQSWRNVVIKRATKYAVKNVNLRKPKLSKGTIFSRPDYNRFISTKPGRGSLPTHSSPPVAAQTRHALHSGNAPNEVAEDSAYLALLIQLQHRDLTPEDYDLLLNLDSGVAPKTISDELLLTFKTDSVTEADLGGHCAVCMENYSVGQDRKYLPCEHVFHSDCIDMWLRNSSTNCPLDGLPVGDS